MMFKKDKDHKKKKLVALGLSTSPLLMYWKVFAVTSLVLLISITSAQEVTYDNIWQVLDDDTVTLQNESWNVSIGANETTDYKLFINGSFGVLDNITAFGGNSTEWNLAYGWGDHSIVGYLLDWSDGDPFYNNSIAKTLQQSWLDTWNASGTSFWNDDGSTLFTSTSGRDVDINGSLYANDITLNQFITGLFGGAIDLSGDPWYLSGTDFEFAENITVGNDIYVQDRIIHVGDEDSYINFNTNQLDFFAGGVNILDLLSTGATFGAEVDMDGNKIVNADMSDYAGENVSFYNGQFNVNLSNLNSTIYIPDNVDLIEGTLDSGNLASIQTLEDGDYYNISEDSGADPLTVIVNFSDVEDFDSVVYRVYYEGGSGHTIHVGLWDTAEGDYEEEYGEITDMDGFATIVVSVFDISEHIDAGAVSLRFYHDDNGIPSHDFQIDYCALIDGFSGLVSSNHDALSNRDADSNHPQYALTDGTRPFTGNVTMEENATVGGNITMEGNSTIDATENITVGRAGDIILGNETEYDMYPDTNKSMNLGTYLNRFNDLWLGGNFYPLRTSQDAQPTPELGELRVWHDSNDAKIYLIYNDADLGIVKIEMT